MSVNPSKAQALRAKESGSSSLYGSSLEKCKDGPEFDQVLEMVRSINSKWKFVVRLE
jgi:biotin synthase